MSREADMSENPVTNELIYQVLQRIQADVSSLKREMGDVKLRLGSVEDHMSSLVTSAVGINHRLDRHDERLERIESRLGLVEA
jgi:DNA anti-recombination protein RmuC